MNESCWEKYGHRGTGECPRLKEVGHCRHCEVYIAAGRDRLNRPFTEEERIAWMRHFSEPLPQEQGERRLDVIVSAAEALYALPAASVTAIVEWHGVHRLPRQGARPMLGVVAWMGKLLPCAHLCALLNSEACGEPNTVLVLGPADALWALAVDSVPGMHEYRIINETLAYTWRKATVTQLNPDDLTRRLREAML